MAPSIATRRRFAPRAIDRRARSPSEITSIGIFRFSDGKVVESWDNFDQLGMVQQIGAIPG